MPSTWLIRLDQTLSSYSILLALVGVILVAGVLHQSGLLGWALGLFGRATRWAVRSGFRVWERWLSWASWWVTLLLAVALLTAGVQVAERWPGVALCCAALTLSMGVVACLAYMFIDIERYEVERGRKAVHNPMKGQDLAPNVALYGNQVGVPLLIAAAASVIGGFALLNQGLFETIGSQWYKVDAAVRPGFVDFLTYAFINLLSLVDILDLADSRQVLHATFVRKGAWPAATMLAVFRSFFTLILLQQVFASVRQGRLLSETIADFWSPHEPIHDRARSALPQFGSAVISPLLVSLREMTALTKEQRDQLPVVLAAIGPQSVPTLVRHLTDTHEHVRAVAASTLGLLRARDVTQAVAALVDDPSDMVRLSAAEALGLIAAAGTQADRSRLVRMPRRRGRWRLFRWRPDSSEPRPTAIAVAALRRALGDPLAAVRSQAAASLGQAASDAVDAIDQLAGALRDTDETVRCQAAESLGQIGAAPELLMVALDDAAAQVRTAGARGLKLLGRKAVVAVPKLIELLQDRDEAVRTSAASAVTAAGPLNGDATSKLVEGLSSPDNVVRAHAAEALGTVAAPAEYAARPLVEAMTDDNDAVRAKAVEALGKIGEQAAKVAVPSLVQALRDRDSWVSALAAEALGEMGVCEGVVPGLIRALSHLNPQVRANSAEAIGKLGAVAATARTAVERAATDEDGGVRAQAVQALGSLGPPPPTTLRLIRTAISDVDPLVRTAAAAAIGTWDQPPEELVTDLLPLLCDPNDQVKVEVAEVLSRWAGAADSVVDGLCQTLSDDDSTWVKANAAIALSRMGPRAVAAGPTLLRSARTGEAAVREQAMRALVMIQPPEAFEGFEAGLTDSAPEVRVVASAGWMKAAAVPLSVAPALIDALRDPEPQVRANIAHALARLEDLPPTALPALRECATDPNDGLRLNAALALRLAPFDQVGDLMNHLLDDPNVRVRLVAAGAVLAANPADVRASAVVVAAADDPSPRVRQSVENLLPLLPAQPTGPAGSEA